jgi:hypothetical protein
MTFCLTYGLTGGQPHTIWGFVQIFRELIHDPDLPRVSIHILLPLVSQT